MPIKKKILSNSERAERENNIPVLKAKVFGVFWTSSLGVKGDAKVSQKFLADDSLYILFCNSLLLF